MGELPERLSARFFSLIVIVIAVIETSKKREGMLRVEEGGFVYDAVLIIPSVKNQINAFDGYYKAGDVVLMVELYASCILSWIIVMFVMIVLMLRGKGVGLSDVWRGNCCVEGGNEKILLSVLMAVWLFFEPSVASTSGYAFMGNRIIIDAYSSIRIVFYLSIASFSILEFIDAKKCGLD